MELTVSQKKDLQQITDTYELSFLVLFGSRAKNQVHSASDVDVGYQKRGEKLSLDEEQNLQQVLENVFKQEVDLRSLHSENPYFLHSSLNMAQFLAGNITAFSRARAYAFQLFHDAQYDLEPIRKSFLEKKMKSLHK